MGRKKVSCWTSEHLGSAVYPEKKMQLDTPTAGHHDSPERRWEMKIQRYNDNYDLTGKLLGGLGQSRASHPLR